LAEVGKVSRSHHHLKTSSSVAADNTASPHAPNSASVASESAVTTHDGNTLKVGSSCSLSHWVYHCFLTKKIKEIREGLGKNKSEKTAVLVKLENQLDKWLEQRSLAQILDWFDCIETTNVRTPMGNFFNLNYSSKS